LAYDYIEQPVYLGSGGGGGYWTGPGTYGGGGGGLAWILVNGTLTNNGFISANGGNGSAGGANETGGGGSGGSIYVNAGTLTGTGTISANGGSGITNGTTSGGGGGGRIAIYYTANTYTGSTTAFGGWGYNNVYGGAGTIYMKPASGNGDLIIDNGLSNNSATSTSMSYTASLAVENFYIARYAKFMITTGHNMDIGANLFLATSTSIYNYGSLTLQVRQFREYQMI